MARIVEGVIHWVGASRPGGWERTARAGVGFAGLALLFFLPLLLGLATFPDGDFTHHFLPFQLFQQRELLAGRLPLWNPYTYAGHPFLADVQAAVFYPISNLLLGLTLPWQSPAARLYLLQVEAAVQVALAGFFVYLLVRALTGVGGAAFLAGALFAFSGYLTGYPPLQLAILRTAIWLPLVLWLLLRAMGGPRRWRWWVAAGLAYGVAFLAGHPQTFLHASYVVAAWLVFLFVRGWQAGEERWHRLPGVGIFLLVALGLSAAQLWPGLEFTRLSVRAQVDYAFVSGGFPLQDSWQLLLPGVLTQYSPLYIGVMGLGLVAVALGALRGLPGDGEGRAGILFFGAVALVALLLAYGDHGFLYPLFYRYAPGWSLFRGQERAAYLVALGLSVLAGYGAAALPRLPLGTRRRVALLFGSLVTGGVYAFGLLWQLPGRTAVGPWHYLLIAFVTLALAMAFCLMLWLPGWSPRRSHWVLLLALANLFWANLGTNLDWVSPARKVQLAPEMEALAAAVAQGPHNGDPSTPGRVYNEYRIYDDYGMRLQIEDVWGSSPLRLAAYAALFDQFPLDRMWQLTGVAHVLTWRRELFVPSQLLAEFPQATDTTYLHRLETPNPRAWLAGAVLAVDDDQALALLADHGFDLEQTALLSPGSALPAGSALSLSQGQEVPTISLQRLAPDRLRVQVESRDGGLLVVSENWMPGWQVVDVSCGPAGLPAAGRPPVPRESPPSPACPFSP
ncbi:MAG: hypothetical protein KatS3mg050_2093 [Litorilinea sp.]|nr:MAG: hypothetical protein KatS3mg050_2093 [Litorilinea sp.]